MYVRTWKKKEKYYASVVKSTRTGDKVIQSIVAYLGEVDENQIPYLKAAYSKRKPKLVFEDGSEYVG